jgi:BirA family biotin operon repressor/biotin-[acetyl-CoA-carboxylase] ligase
MSFDTALFQRESAARGLTLGRPIHWRDETQSTNDDALTAAKDGAPHGALFGAETQARGRGRRGSEWVSAPGGGLWFSLLLRPTLSAEQAPGLSLCAGLAVRDAVATRVSAAVQVKWPNDVLAGGRKLAGILVESQVIGKSLGSVVVGIGINVTQTAFPDALVGVATSLSLLSAADSQRERLLSDVLQGIETELARLAHAGLSAIAERLREHDALLGKRLRVGVLEGTAAGIDASGHLRLQKLDGQLERVASGHVELLGA